MQNPILQMLNASQSPQNNIMMQAVGAMMRGESPQSFLQSAKNNPQLQGLDLSNPSKAAETLYSQNGQDINAAKNTIIGKISSFMK